MPEQASDLPPPDWIAQLRQQAQRIADGGYNPDTANYANAPPAIQALSGDLDALAQAMAERDAVQHALTHEVHHRVKNNLQIVSSLLNMQASRSQIPAVRQALGQTRARMDALALLHRLLYEDGDDGTRGTVDSAGLLAQLCGQLRQWHKDRDTVSFTWSVTGFALPLDSAVPLALFTVEAITNAYAHAFPEQRPGRITLASTISDNGHAQLVIADDGVGYAADAALPNRTSMGRALMDGLASQLGGTHAVMCEVGTVVRLDYQIKR